MTATSSRPDDLILGTASGYGPERLSPFLPSLARSGFRGRLVLFGGGADLLTAFPDLPFSLEVAPAPSFRWEPRPGWRLNGYSRPLRPVHWLLPRLLKPFPAWRRRVIPYLHGPVAARFFYYHHYLATGPGREAGRVLLTDVRDVFFQADPFADPALDDARLHVFLEDGRFRLRDEPNTREWVRVGFGPAGVERIGDRPISCAGVTVGVRTAMLAYLTAMTDRLADLTDRLAPIWGSDQGVHNYLLHTGQFPGAVVHENGRGPVLTVGLFDSPERLGWDADGRPANADGCPAPVVHQYDRLPFLEVTGDRDRPFLRRRPTV